MNEASWPEDINAESGCRLPVADRALLNDDDKKRYDRIAAKLDGAVAGLQGPTGLSFHSPGPAVPGQSLNIYLRSEADISPALREVAILSVAREMDCRFEWAAHEGLALKDGVDAELVELIKSRAATEAAPDSYAAVIDACRELITGHRLSSSTFARLAADGNRQNLVDVLLLIGNYVSLAVLLLSVDQQLPPGDQAELPIPWRSLFPNSGNSVAAEAGGDIDQDSGSRLPHVEREILDDEGKDRYDRMLAGLDGVKNGLNGPGGLMLHSPQGAKHALALNQSLRGNPDVADDLREVAILSVARAMDCQYEWAAHEPIALKCGVPQETVDAIKHRRPLDGVSAVHTEIISLVRQLFTEHQVSSDCFGRLSQRYESKMIMDLILLIGNYTALAILLLAVDQQLPPGDQAELPIP